MPRLIEELELIVWGKVNGGRSAEVSFRTREAARRYLHRFQTAIQHENERHEEFAGVDFSDISSAWIAGERTGEVYFQ